MTASLDGRVWSSRLREKLCFKEIKQCVIERNSPSTQQPLLHKHWNVHTLPEVSIMRIITRHTSGTR